MKHASQRSSLKNNKKYKRTPAPHLLIDKDLVLAYLQGSRNEALENIAYSLGKFDFNEIRPMLKKSIHSYVMMENPEFEGNTYTKDCIYHMLANFNATEFVKRKWQYVPYYLSRHDYSTLHSCKKFPIHITNYDYDSPVYSLKNNFIFTNRKDKHKRENRYSEEKIKNDVRFYVAKDENILCAKLITLKYKPQNIQEIKRNVRALELSEEGVLENSNLDNTWTFTENPRLYSRSLSISMYVLLDGDPNKAMPYLRYDSEEGEHNNVYVGDDKRKAIFGEKAKSPHFHFQNETDSLLCLAKFTGDEGQKYKTGRCNAIDCQHLRKYLSFLDRLSDEEIYKQNEENLHYGMPFLEIKMRPKATKIDFVGAVYKFMQKCSKDEIEKLSQTKEWIEWAKGLSEYKNENGRKFGKFKMALDFIEYIVDLKTKTTELQTRDLLTQLEIICADALINGISSCQTNEIDKQQQIDGTFLCNPNDCEQENE